MIKKGENKARRVLPAVVIAIVLSSMIPAQRAELSPLERRVRRALVTLPYYSVFDNLSFRIEGTTVTLMGQVTRPTLRSNAEAAVKNESDVGEVINQIEVLPLSPQDDRIRMSLYQAIFYNPTFTRYAIQAVPPIHLLVNRGHVTLEGVVSSEGDKNYAEVLAKSVPGVFSVTNNLVVESK